MASSTVSIVYILNSPSKIALSTSLESTKSSLLDRGITTPFPSVSSMILHTSKNPSIFSFTPPIGCT